VSTSHRTAMVAQAAWGVSHEGQIHYAEKRPIPYADYKAHKLPITTDCSGFVSCISYAVGIPDPNGQGYNGQGYTGTLLTHLEHIDKRELLAGDFVVFGPYPGEHVCMAVEAVSNHADPKLVSHGTEAGPLYVRLSAEATYHSPPVTYLRSIPVVSTKIVWDVRNGRNELVAKGISHPGRWGMRHAREYRRYDILSYHARRVPS
jgi:hypothetical protein